MRLIITITISLFLFAACKKDDDQNNTNVITVVPNDSVSALTQIVKRSAQCKDSFRLVGNDAGAAQLLTEFLEFTTCISPGTFYKKRFVYEGAKVYIIDSSAGQKTTDTLIIDNARRISGMA